MRRKRTKDAARRERISGNIFKSYIILISVMMALLIAGGSAFSVFYENGRIDENLTNIAKTLARSEKVIGAVEESLEESGGGQNDAAQGGSEDDADTQGAKARELKDLGDDLYGLLEGIDVISVVNSENTRVFHSNGALIGTEYTDIVPDFTDADIHADTATGVSGKQRRVYAAIYDTDGNYIGFLLVAMLSAHIFRTISWMLTLFVGIALIAALISVIASRILSDKIRKKTLGYEPYVFASMYKTRDNILESLEEGIIAVDEQERIVFVNNAADKMMKPARGIKEGMPLGEAFENPRLGRVLLSGEKEFNVPVKASVCADIIADYMPVKDGEKTVGAVGIYHDRTEYTLLAQELTGTKFLVDSMRANNHEFTNKLHVIMGLLQMKRYDEASEYISGIAMVQRETIHNIITSIEDPQLAALLIGKQAKAAELDIHFSLEKESRLRKTDVDIPSEVLVTVMGNLIENSMEAVAAAGGEVREISVFVFSDPKGLVMKVADSGCGMSGDVVKKAFEKGFSTKGEGRGNGLFKVKELCDMYGGTLEAQSEPGEGTIITAVV